MKIAIGKNQYLLTKKCIDKYQYNQKFNIGKYFLYLGEDCQYFSLNDKIHVLGYAVNSQDSKMDLNQMCYALYENIKNGEFGPNATKEWCGRWIVIIDLNDELIVWSDACGLKQVFYMSSGKEFCIASQARYIAQLYTCEINKEAIEHFSNEKISNEEFSLPVGTTIYKNIKRLLPNHYLNEKERCVVRSSIKKHNTINLEKEISDLLVTCMEAMANRYKLAVTITGGWDSRLVLSSCIGIKSKIYPVTLKYKQMGDNHYDLIEAKRICTKLKIEHNILECRDDNAFSLYYSKHAENPHTYWIQMVEAINNSEYKKMIWVKGSCNEIVRNPFGILKNSQVNEKVLCKLFDIMESPFSLAVVGEWINEAKVFCEKNDISILDLFYWEHRCGSWLAECLNEADCVGETFTPYNCKLYLEQSLSIEQKRRIPPKYEIFSSIFDTQNVNNICKPQILSKNIFVKFKEKLKYLIKYKLHIVYKIVINYFM